MVALPFCIPEKRVKLLGILASPWRGRGLSDAAIDAALRRPIGWGKPGRAVEERVRPGESVCLVVSDQTRQTAADRVLPVLWRRLARRGVKASDGFVLVATGIHRPPDAAELRRILGADMQALFAGRIFCHDPDAADLVAVGRTRRGHEVRLNRRAVEADRLILIGSAAYHYHAGFGGGRKALVPGLADRATIAHTHSLTLDPRRDRIRPGVGIGRLAGNAVAGALLEAARLRPPDFIINTVLAPDGRLAGVFAGELDRAHRAACRLAARVARAEIAERADLVVADAGHVETWIQAHKALFNASRAVRARGRIVLLAPCREGLGNERFRYWITRPTLPALYRGLRRSPEVNGQTALSTRQRGARAILVTRLPARDRRDLGLRCAPTPAAAIGAALDDLGRAGIRRPTCYVMPEAIAVVPFAVRRRARGAP